MHPIRPLHELVAATHSPFHPDGSLAPEIVPAQASFLSANGIRTVFITGTTGESHSLTREERLSLFRAWAAAGPAEGLSVIAHVGSNSIEDAKASRAGGPRHRPIVLQGGHPSHNLLVGILKAPALRKRQPQPFARCLTYERPSDSSNLP